MDKKPSRAVLGIGNPLRRDDGLGIRIIEEMRRMPGYDDFELIDGGTSPDLLSLLDESIKKLVIVDSLRGSGPPGTIYRLEVGQENITGGTASSHGLGVLDTVSIMPKLGLKPPQIIIIGVEPEDVSHGLGLTPCIERMLPEIIRAVDGELKAAD